MTTRQFNLNDYGAIYCPHNTFDLLWSMGLFPKEIVEAVNDGRIALVNSPALHQFFGKKELHKLLSIAEVDIPLTFVDGQVLGRDAQGVYHRWKEPKRSLVDIITRRHPEPNYENISEMLSERHPDYPLWVIKKASEKTGDNPFDIEYVHSGEGVRISKPDEALLKEGSIVQEFLYLPFEDGYMRDIRFLLVGGEIKGIYSRRARGPILGPDGQPLRDFPKPEQYLTNVSKGASIEEPPEDLVEIARQTADYTYKFIRLGISANMGNVHEKLRTSTFSMGLISIDVVFDDERNPKVLEVDQYPNYLSSLARNREFRDALGEYFSEIANGKKVILFLPQYTKEALTSVLRSRRVGYAVMTYDAKIKAFVVK